jgi:glycosyltransferase involved in cell wall biosynthesis
MRKIVFVCNEYPPRPHAGIGTAVQLFTRGLASKGHSVTVVGLGNETENHRDGTIRVFTLKASLTPYIGNLISRLRLRRWLSHYVKSEKIDLVEVPDTQGLLPFGLNGTAIVVRLHLSFTAVSRVTSEKTGPAISLYERRTVSKNRNWIAVSDYVRNLTEATFCVQPRRCTTVYNPILPPPQNLPEIPDLPAEFILYAGHVGRRKGADVLAKAAREILPRYPNLHLVYAGGIFIENDGPMSEAILKIVGPQLSPRVHFLGRVDRLQALSAMKRARVFAFPSHVEGFPMVILEALSCGAPVVFTKHPPGPEIIEDGVTGLLADPREPQDFSGKIDRLLANPALAKEMGENGRKRVTTCFSIENCVHETENFYELCLKDRAKDRMALNSSDK